jgi:hypothetical protein
VVARLARERMDLLRVLGTEVFSTGADSETSDGDGKSRLDSTRT